MSCSVAWELLIAWLVGTENTQAARAWSLLELQ